VQLLFDAGGSTVVHFVMGAALVLFATAVFDFHLPRWVTLAACVAAATLGGIFLLQGIAEVTQLEPIRFLAFDVLGRWLERLLPDVMYLWFVLLLLLASSGITRVLGWIVMVIVVVYEIASWASLLFGFPMVNLSVVVLLLPFVWLAFESGKRRTPAAVPREQVAAAT
jgi:hypothetical protein